MGGDVWIRLGSDKYQNIPIKNTKDEQTYFGALDYQTQEFIVQEYPCKFIKYYQVY